MSLKGKVCVVTGATRGIGRGTAVALAEQGAIVYVSGRSTGSVDELTIEGTIAAINAAGGEGHGMRVDHAIDSEIEGFFEYVGSEQGKIDILVNNVYKIPNPPAWGGGFWDHPFKCGTIKSASDYAHIMLPVGMPLNGYLRLGPAV